MTFREADGGDKIAAFERGVSDAEAHLAFETPGVTGYILNERTLVAVAFRGEVLAEVFRRRIYGVSPDDLEVSAFLRELAEASAARLVVSSYPV